MKRKVAVVSGTRADYGLLYYPMKAIAEHPDLELQLVVCGMHLAPEFGLTVRQIEADGFPIAARVDTLLSGDSGPAAAKSVGVAVMGLAQAFAALQPDLVLLLGDRSEILGAAVAALHMQVPVAHIHGGESTLGAIDDSIRHAITKMAALHFAATAEYAGRIRQMGEEPWRVFVSGAPGLDHMRRTSLFSREEVSAQIGLDFGAPVLLAAYHPVTTEPDQVEYHYGQFLEAIAAAGVPAVITYPNADAGGRLMVQMLERFVQGRPGVVARPSLGSRLYLSAMKHAAAMVGNSSSGIIEAPSFGLPAVNIGSRQEGRIQGANVINVAPDRESIAAGIRRALTDEEFRKAAAAGQNPYGDGNAGPFIARTLAEVRLGGGLIQKGFVKAGD